MNLPNIVPRMRHQNTAWRPAAKILPWRESSRKINRQRMEGADRALGVFLKISKPSLHRLNPSSDPHARQGLKKVDRCEFEKACCAMARRIS
jgi:hypothetical protein